MKYTRVTLIVLMFTLTSEGTSMAFFEKPVLFSQVTGVVTINGTPLANVEVNRQLKHFESIVADSTVTDSDGKFKFKTIYRKRFQLYDILPHQVVILQQIVFKHNGREYDGYFNQKMNYLNNGELKGKPIFLLCDLNDQYVDNDGLFMGICRLRKEIKEKEL